MHHPFLVQLTYFLTFFQRQWLHSSVGRASHRYREVTGSNPVEVLNFFQASLRNCINCVHCDDHFFIFITYFLLQSCWWARSWLWKRNLLQLLTVLIHGIFFYCLTLSFKLTKHTCKRINIIVAAVVLIFFLSEKKNRIKRSWLDGKHYTPPQVISFAQFCCL